MVSDLTITPEGILLDTIDVVQEKFQAKYKAAPVSGDSGATELLNNNLVWRTGEYADGVFTGLFLVFGKGNVYIYCDGGSAAVEIQDVVKKGKKVGYFEDDRVDVTIRGAIDDSYTAYAVLEYNNQYFGPYQRRMK